MSFNKEILIKNFKEKKYSTCIEMLTNELIRILTLEIQAHNPQYEYKNITNLRTQCLKYLDNSRKEVALQLHDFMFHEEYTETFILDSLLSMYEQLTKQEL